MIASRDIEVRRKGPSYTVDTLRSVVNFRGQRVDASDRLYLAVGMPTLLLWGDSDRLVPPAYGEAYQKHIPGAELKLIPKCGHLPMFEKEAEFVEMVTKFCQA